MHADLGRRPANAFKWVKNPATSVVFTSILLPVENFRISVPGLDTRCFVRHDRVQTDSGTHSLLTAVTVMNGVQGRHT